MNPFVLLLVAAAAAVALAGRRKTVGIPPPSVEGPPLPLKSAYGPAWVAWVTPSGIKACLDNKGEKSLPLYSAVTVKILDGKGLSWWENKKTAGKPNRDWINKMFALADAAGCARWGWGYHYCYNPSRAAQEGKAAGQAAKKYGVAVYSCNVERYWIAQDKNAPKNWKMRGTKEAIRESAQAFLAAFREEAPGIQLHLCPAAWPVTRLAEQALDGPRLALWDGLDRMLFGKTANNWQRKKFDHAAAWAAEAQKFNPAFDFMPLFPSGSNIPDYEGSVAATVAIETSTPTQTAAVYYGDAGGDMWVDGKGTNIPWSQAIPEIQQRESLGDPQDPWRPVS